MAAPPSMLAVTPCHKVTAVKRTSGCNKWTANVSVPLRGESGRWRKLVFCAVVMATIGHRDIGVCGVHDRGLLLEAFYYF